MDGVHDMGGMHGFGPVEVEADEPVFHAPWEGRTYAMNILAAFVTRQNVDQFRKTLERMPPADYLRSSYYEKWLWGLQGLLLADGAATAQELADGAPRQPLPAGMAGNPPPGPGIVPMLTSPGPAPAVPAGPMRFAVGARVRTRAHMGFGHNRLPRYARDKVGIVERVLGPFLLPDAHSEGEDVPECVYTIVFQASDLWGAEANARDSLTLDLWDSYLDPAEG